MSTVLDVGAAKLARWLVSSPKTVVALLVATIVACAMALPHLRMEAGTSAFLDEHDDSRVFLSDLEKHFVGEDTVYVGYQTKDVFSNASLTEIRELGEKIQAITRPIADGGTSELIQDVLSLATVKDVSGADQSYRSVPLVPEDSVPTEQSELDQIKARANGNPMIKSGLLGKTPTMAGMLVRMAGDPTDDARAAVVHDIRTLTEQATAKSGTEFFITGSPVAMVDTASYMVTDLKQFIPICYVLLLVTMMLFTRRIAGVVVSVINATIANLVGMALVAVFASLTNVSTTMPPMLLVLSVATMVHFMSEYGRHAELHGDAHAAEHAIRELMVPTFMCEATTAVGFISFAFSPIPALREFGVAAAIAVMGAFFTSFLVIAITVRFFKAEQLMSRKESKASQAVAKMMAYYANLAIRRPWPMLGLMVVLTILSIVGLRTLRVDHNDVEQFSPGLPFRTATDTLNEKLGGSAEIVVSLRTETPNRFYDPVVLKKVEALQHFLEAELGATSTASFVDYVKLMNRGFNDDTPSEHRIPDTREQIAQLVLMNGDDRLFDFIDHDAKWLRITARTTVNSSAILAGYFDRIETYLGKEFPASEGYVARGTGRTHLSVVMTSNILGSQTSSFLISFALIFLPIVLMFGSVIAGLFTIPSNLFPILATMGFMGWVDIPLDVATTMIASIILGIAVDDTIHIIQDIRRLLAEGMTMEDALRESLTTKGVGALWISLIITLGFGALVTSAFSPTAHFGILTASGMFAGVIAEVCLLPPLLLLTKTRLGVPLPEKKNPAKT